MSITSRCAPRAFSLVEILVAILVLAFGLLGLAAVFPVVVTQQRDAADVTFGPTAANSVRAAIFADTGVVRWDAVALRARPAPPPGGPGGIGGIESGPERWTVDYRNQSGLTSEQRIMTIDPDTGWIEFRGTDPRTSTLIEQELPAAARLFPLPSGSVQPRFVWDVAVRRSGRDRPLEAALFVRRIDTGIRVPNNRTLVSVLTGAGLSPPEPTAVPVAVDPSSGRPTRTGVGDYAAIRELRETDTRIFNSRTGVFDRFELRNLTAVERSLISRRGQKLVDAYGVVRTVVDVDANERVVVEPPFPSDDRVQMLYTPQVPVSVEVFAIGGAG